MLKLLRRKSFRKSKEFKPGSKSTLNSSSGSVSNAGGQYYIRPQRSSARRDKVSLNTDTSQNSLDRKSIGSHRYSSVNLGSPVPAPEIVQYSRPPENLTSPVRESLETTRGCPPLVSSERPKVKEAGLQVMNVISAVRNADETAARLRTGNVMPTPRCLPPTPKRSTGHSSRPSAQALPTPSTVHSTAEAVIPKPSARMSLRTKVFFYLCQRLMALTLLWIWALECRRNGRLFMSLMWKQSFENCIFDRTFMMVKEHQRAGNIASSWQQLFSWVSLYIF